MLKVKNTFKKVPGLIWGSLAIIALFAIIAPNFMKYQNIVNILKNASILMIVSMGMGMAILSSQIDMSIGGVMTISAMAAAIHLSRVVDPGAGDIAVTVGIGAFVGTLFGLFNGIMIGKFKYNYWLVTFATMSIGYGAAQAISGGVVISGFSMSFRNISSFKLLGIPIVIFIAIAIAGIMIFVTYRTKFGMHLYAVGDSEQCAAVSGINIPFIRIVIYVISGFLSGIGGVLLISKTNSASANVANGYEFSAIANVIIGGMSFEGGRGGLLGTVFGTLIIISITNGLQLLGMSNYWQQVLTGLFILAIIVIDVVNERQKRINSLRRVYKNE